MGTAGQPGSAWHLSPTLTFIIKIAAQPARESQVETKEGRAVHTRPPLAPPCGGAAGLRSGRLPSFDPSVNIGFEEADLAPSVPREAYPLRKHAVLLPAP